MPGTPTSIRGRTPVDETRELVPADAATLLREPEEVDDAVLRMILERAREGSIPGERTDGSLVCLAIEGGGMRAAVTAGMCVALEAAGLTASFDRVYGVSAGALNGWGFAAGQAAIGSTHYLDAVRRGVVRRTAPLRGRPLVDLGTLFDELIAARKPLSYRRLAGGPEFRALATSLETMTLRVLADFADVDELIQAVHASAALPRLGGEPPVFRGERMTDGSLIEPIPFASALREGATHVLVLRSRPEGYRKPYYVEVGETLAVRDDPALSALLQRRQGAYNRQASMLERAWSGPGGGARLTQIAVPRSTRLVGRLESNAERLSRAIGHGASAVARALLTEQVELHWQPVVYRART